MDTLTLTEPLTRICDTQVLLMETIIGNSCHTCTVN